MARKRIPRSFFEAAEVVFIGYSSKEEGFSSLVADTFEKSGAKVYPVNPDSSRFKRAVYKDVASVPGKPELAYLLTGKRHNLTLLDAVAARGIKRVLFQSPLSADAAVLDKCRALGLEAQVACPMMAFGGGFHRFHGWLAGVAR